MAAGTINPNLTQQAMAIQAIYDDYLKKLENLKTRQNTIITQLIKDLEQKRLEELRKSLKS